jgi:hypothetical protein
MKSLSISWTVEVVDGTVWLRFTWRFGWLPWGWLLGRKLTVGIGLTVIQAAGLGRTLTVVAGAKTLDRSGPLHLSSYHVHAL